MSPPFTIEQFLEVFKNYNQAVFPAQFVLYIISGVAVYLVLKPTSKSDEVISFILAALWLWMGVIYHLHFFSAVNKAAYLFGIMFILQAMLFIIYGVVKTKLSFNFKPNIYGFTGFILILFSLIAYPLVGYILGHRYPSSPSFGLPCPTTIFTFGLLLMNTKKTPILILVIPILWSIIGFMAAIQFDIREDIALLLSGLLTLALLTVKHRMSLKTV